MPPPGAPRSAKRVLIISVGFGRLLFPAQAQLVERAGYQIHWCTKPPNPETPNFAMGPHLQQIKSELDQFRPDLVMCASKGGAYVVGLWEAGLWLGPTLMINAHPTCVRLPRGVPVVLAAGGDDEHYPSTRKALHRLVATGTASHSFLYYAAGSGPRLPPGFAPRPGDRHNMDSLLQNDCLPRLMDAALCPEGAEVAPRPDPHPRGAGLGEPPAGGAAPARGAAAAAGRRAAPRRRRVAGPVRGARQPGVRPGRGRVRGAAPGRVRLPLPGGGALRGHAHRRRPPRGAPARRRRRRAAPPRGAAGLAGAAGRALRGGRPRALGLLPRLRGLGAGCRAPAPRRSVGCWHLLRARGEALLRRQKPPPQGTPGRRCGKNFRRRIRP
ncbi:unnamed protein product [Prorocentrum cordatum]|uniref:Uncharacterized protein n=1 Tax=Prorocentrum cordatum TaxID=2364126 RepID=A0ABN9S050_9DINO|nr:unnamed protein product [Polarella glacialis]